MVNSAAELWHVFTLTLTDPTSPASTVPGMVAWPRDMVVREGEEVVVEMEVQGTPEPRYEGMEARHL